MCRGVVAAHQGIVGGLDRPDYGTACRHSDQAVVAGLCPDASMARWCEVDDA